MCATGREVLPADVVVQVPPNLVEGGELLRACLEAGAADLGGISPRDEVNPSYLFPSGTTLEVLLSGWGFVLEKRKAVHARLESQAYGGAGMPPAGSSEAGLGRAGVGAAAREVMM